MTQRSQRVYVEGRGSTVLALVQPGDTTIPLESVDMFTAAAGVFLKASFQGSEGGAQHLTFSGVDAGGGGTIVGPGISPAAAPAASATGGAGLTTGTYGYAVTFVTAAGESLPSPTRSVAVGGLVANPASPPGAGIYSNAIGAPYPFATGDAIRYWAYTWTTAAGETLPSPTMAPGGSYPLGPGGPYAARFDVWGGPYPTSVTGINVYRTAQGSAQLKLVASLGWAVFWTYTDHTTDAALGANVPTSNTALAGNQVTLSSIPIGGAGVTARKIYRTVVGGAQLKLQSTIADNTTTTLVDATADGSLGANVVTSDTSGLAQPEGQVVAGSISILIAGAGAFLPGGGWASIGNGDQLMRYTGITGNTLTGIPTSGAGSIQATVAYNSTITAAPMVTGIPASGTGAITRALSAGDEVYLVVQRDDLAAQAALAALLGGDGVREEWIQDRRLSIPEATARGDAFLNLRSVDNGRSITYTSRDLNTKAGAMITVNLGPPTNVTGTFRIQRVTWSDFRPFANQLPTATVEASAVRYSFEDLLRQRRSGA